MPICFTKQKELKPMSGDDEEVENVELWLRKPLFYNLKMSRIWKANM